MSLLALEDLTKTFLTPSGRQVTALRGLNMSLQKAELLVLVGPSGCGKTTTLRLIAGLEQPTRGKIVFAGTVLNNIPAKERDVAMVFQNHALFPHLTVFENMGFGLKLRKVPASEIEQRVRAAADSLGIADKMHCRPDELSGGEAQRVALGRALVRQPKLFLLDEPLSNLDAATRVQLRGEIKKLQQQLGVPMIYVTHDETEAIKLGDRIAVLHQGELQQIGTATELKQQPATPFVGAFFSLLS